jgi:hypothetical protein
MPRTKKADMYMARESFATTIDDEPIFVRKGELARAGHPILKSHGDLFEPAEDFIRFDVEQATAAPGEKRGGPEPVRPSPMVGETKSKKES